MSNNSTCTFNNGTTLCDFLDASNHHSISDSKCPNGNTCCNIYIEATTAAEHIRKYHTAPSAVLSKQYKSHKPVRPKLPADNKQQNKDQLAHLHKRRPRDPPMNNQIPNHLAANEMIMKLVQAEVAAQFKNLNNVTQPVTPPVVPVSQVVPPVAPPVIPQPVQHVTPVPLSDAQTIQMLNDLLAQRDKEIAQLREANRQLNEKLEAKGTVCNKYHPKIPGKSENDNRPSKEEMESKHANSGPSGCMESVKVLKVYCAGGDMWSLVRCGTKTLVNGTRYCPKHYKPKQDLPVNPSILSQPIPNQIPVPQSSPNEVVHEPTISFADE